MNDKIKFAHTNIIARDWKRLAQFYIDVFAYFLDLVGDPFGVAKYRK